MDQVFIISIMDYIVHLFIAMLFGVFIGGVSVLVGIYQGAKASWFEEPDPPPRARGRHL
jgi:hypothetical protein